MQSKRRVRERKRNTQALALTLLERDFLKNCSLFISKTISVTKLGEMKETHHSNTKT